MNGVEFSFNWFYADDRDIALFSSGRLPVRAPGTDPRCRLSAVVTSTGAGSSPSPATRGINPPSGAIVNWNNRPAPNVGAADSNFSYGSVHRVDLLRAAVAGRKKHTLATLTGAMNKAATQDLRVARVWPIVKAVLQTGTAPSARAEAAANLLDNWRLRAGRAGSIATSTDAWTIPGGGHGCGPAAHRGCRHDARARAARGSAGSGSRP